MPEKRRYGRSRRDLAEAAMECFERRGFAAATVDEIAAAAGYSARTFFRQFPTKEDVVFFDLGDILEPLEALPATDVWNGIRRVVLQNSREWEAAGPHLAQARTRLIHEEPALYRRFLEIAAEWEQVAARALAAERGTDPATDVHAQTLACATIGGMRTALRVWLASPGRALADCTAEVLDEIARGFDLR